MSVIIILEAETKPGKRSTLMSLLQKYLPQTRQYKGFIDISIHTQLETNLVLFYEQWETIKDYESYLQWRTETGVMEELGKSLLHPPTIRYFSTETFKVGNN